MGALMIVMASWLVVGGSLGGGAVSGHLDQWGGVHVTLPDGTRCSGSMMPAELHLGSLYCPGGRIGSFHWTMDRAGHGYGVGSLDGDRLELTFDPS